ncbi:MAG: PIN domain-containing protein [Acidobacteria bacterium]|nr:PIN domain-containing protein [Acidobacteriota bacterium]
MIAVDTNLLVYAHREDSSWHDAAFQRLAELAEGKAPWAIPWPCLHEFIAIVTHPRIYDPPTPLDMALEQVAAWLESPGLVLLSEVESYWEEIREVLKVSRVSGPQIHDARVVALCQLHGVEELWTADRDLGRFASLKARNPLVA